MVPTVSGSEGTDLLTGVEIVQGASSSSNGPTLTGRFLLVGNGGFSNEEAAKATPGITLGDIILDSTTATPSAQRFDGTKWVSYTWPSYPPLILSLSDNPVSTLSLEAGPRFAYDVQGPALKTGWVAGGNALLVRDLDSDGRISHGGELFGDRTLLKSGARATDGYHALRDLDDNLDGRIDSSDKAFAELMLWQDIDVDGLTDAGELSRLADHGIASLGLDARPSDRVDHGNPIKLVSSYTLADGTTREMADAWFGVAADAVDDPAESLFVNHPSSGASSLPSDLAAAQHPHATARSTDPPEQPSNADETLERVNPFAFDDLSDLMMRNDLSRA